MATHKLNEIHITRVYDAPVSAVWDAWTDPVQTAQWWGPRGFTITTHSRDLREGGHWSYTMHGPDGTDYPNTTKYLEVKKHAKLVYDHGGHEDRPPMFRVTALFSEINGRTTLQMCMTLDTDEAAAQTRVIIRKAGGNTTWDRLAEFLEKQATGKEQFVINRSFESPLELMFELWTDPKHLSHWLSPKGSSMKFIHADIRPGGTSFYEMTMAGDAKMFGKCTYLTIDRPKTLTYTQQFCDANGNVSRHPFAATWPETMLTTITFAEESAGHTRVTVTWEPFGNISAAELETFIKAREGMSQGWTGSFDNLEAYLPTH